MLLALSTIVGWLFEFKYVVLFPAAIIEGPVVTIIAGLMVSLGVVNGAVALFLILIADLVGDAIYYMLGRWGGFVRWGKYVGATPERINDLEKHFAVHAGKTLMIGKLSHGIGVVALVAAGVARVNFWKFLWYNLLATVPKSLILLLVGYYFGAVYTRIIKYLDYLAAGMVILGIGLVVGLIFISRRLRASEAKERL